MPVTNFKNISLTTNKKIVRNNELARLLKVNRNTIYDWVFNKKIPFKKINGIIQYDTEQIKNWLEKKQKETYCKNCEKPLILGQVKWCSHSCQKRWWARNNKGRFKFICEHCKKDFYRDGRLNAKGYPHRFCSRICSNIAGGPKKIIEKTRHKTQGYISLWDPKHPRAYAGRVREHILVLEKKLGRPIKKGEIVHHINYLEDDNRPENLYLCSDNYAHQKIHGKSRYLIKEFIRMKGLSKELTEYLIAHVPELKR